MPRVRLALTLGDPRGIGPEVAVAAAASVRDADLLFVGPGGTVADASDVPLHRIGQWRPADGAAAAGRLAAAAIRTAAEMALAGRVDGIVTAPIDKAALRAGGAPWPGHTEMLAELAGGVPVAMMLAAERTSAGGPLRVVLATTHLALRDVPAALNAGVLVQAAAACAAGLRAGWGIEQPRVALCAFNPHASDGGLFGDEEARIYPVALQELQRTGVDAHGPFPADTVFVRAMRGEFDAVVAPYHDVGMAAFKTAAFGSGVNVTLGLPFVRTSPDHGTALDIAGRGTADPASMIEAVRLAVRLAARARGRAAGAAPHDPHARAEP
jgi:4-hydroxythreonine-4-phosphate dehydrogenase